MVLEAQSNTTVHLVLSYVVSHAGWSPRYDIRVFSRDKEMQVQDASLVIMASSITVNLFRFSTLV